MIRSIRGTVIDITEQSVVINVHGVGYLVHTNTAGKNILLDTEQSFWTYLAVRETALDLYGFTTRDELEIFELLLGLPKIGPKSAAQILAQADIALLTDAVTQGDPTYLSKMSGIGKKTAEKIVHELKDVFAERGLTASTHSGIVTTGWQQETIDALVALGYPHKDARDAVQALPDTIADTNTALTTALRSLSS